MAAIFAVLLVGMLLPLTLIQGYEKTRTGAQAQGNCARMMDEDSEF